MRIGVWALSALVALGATGCGKSTKPVARDRSANAAEIQAAADANSVTSIPGYTPEAGNAGAGNAAKAAP
jgi:hypothetical protein